VNIFSPGFALPADGYYYSTMTKTETTILESRTPEDYIDRSLKARLSPAAKAKLARHWMEATGYTKEDILRARNRHPYWKRKKMEGSAERTRRRLAAHDYSAGASVRWDKELVGEFLGLSRKDSEGRYEQKDWQLAERFSATIPSIQYMRRKLSRVESLLGSRASSAKVVDYLLRAESVLSRGKEAVEELKASRKERAAGPSPAAGRKAAKPKAAKPKAGSAKPKAVSGKAPGKKAAAARPKAAPQKAAPQKAAPQKTRIEEILGKKNPDGEGRQEALIGAEGRAGDLPSGV
jgi:hypothetical protein